MAISKRIILPLFAIAVLAMFCSCGSTKKIVYFQGADSIDLSSSQGLYDARIMPKDQLRIYVSTSDPDVSRQFNMAYNMASSGGGSIAGNSRDLQEFLVDNNGRINFPVLGFVEVEGLTSRECEEKIHDLIMPYMAASEDPIVTVRMSSYHITVIGETGSRVIPVETERMSIVEALATAGDLTLYGRRDNILLIREDKTGKKSTHRLDISDAAILNSEYYYLQQNDIIYVEPNKTLISRTAISNNTMWLSLVTSLASFGALIVALLK